MSLSIDPAAFAGEAILKSLEGERVVRVSRKTIVDALKSQTATISVLFQDALEKAELIKALEDSNRNLTKLVYDLSDKLDGLTNTVEEQGQMVLEHEEILGSGKIERLFIRVDALEAKMSEAEQNMEEGFETAREDRERIESEAKNQLREVRHLITGVKEEADQLDVRASSLEERLKDLGYLNKDGVFRIRGDRVAIGANEVVSTDMFKSLRNDLNKNTKEMKSSINEHTDLIESMQPNVKLLPELIDITRENQQMFKDLGLGGTEPGEKGVLQQFADMKEDMVDVQKKLLEKCDITKMLETVELKYDEIVDHLQEAIQVR